MAVVPNAVRVERTKSTTIAKERPDLVDRATTLGGVDHSLVDGKRI